MRGREGKEKGKEGWKVGPKGAGRSRGRREGERKGTRLETRSGRRRGQRRKIRRYTIVGKKDQVGTARKRETETKMTVPGIKGNKMTKGLGGSQGLSGSR